MSSEDFESCLKIFCHFESIGEGVLGSDLIQVLEIFYGYQQVSSLRSPPGLLDLKKDQPMMDISLFCVFISDKNSFLTFTVGVNVFVINAPLKPPNYGLNIFNLVQYLQARQEPLFMYQ
jgi:hypothetical protein